MTELALWEYLRDEIALAKRQRESRRDRSCGAVHLSVEIAEIIADKLEHQWRAANREHDPRTTEML